MTKKTKLMKKTAEDKLRRTAFHLGVSVGLTATTGLWVLMRALDLQSDGFMPAWVRAIVGAVCIGAAVFAWWSFDRTEKRR